jgi:hypothetical protein
MGGKWPDKLYLLRCRKSEKPKPRRGRKRSKRLVTVKTTKILLKERAHALGLD